MSFPRYAEYKESGDAFIEEVPSHWRTLKIARAFSTIGSGTTPKSDNHAYYDEGTIPWVNTGDLNDAVLKESNRRVTEKALADHSTLRIYPAGSLIFAMYGATIGRIAKLDFPATVNQACCVFGGESPIEVDFLFYWFLGLRDRILSLATGGGQPNVSQDILRTLRVPCPYKQEQRAIAAFLDRETSKIDALVAEQRRLIALLKEKRQAVISHAVTKGLDPTVKLKDSGIEWLGQVPEHWEVMKLKRVFSSVDYGISESLSPEGNVAILRMGNIQDGRLDLSDLKFVDSVDDRLILVPGDLLYNRTNSLDLIGKVGLFAEQSEGPVSFASYLVRLRTVPESVPQYFAYLLNMDGMLGMARSLAFVAIGQCNLNPTRYGMISIAAPPRKEQLEIVRYLDTEVSRIDALVTEAVRTMEVLSERRSAVVSAAVTGKIDIRK